DLFVLSCRRHRRQLAADCCTSGARAGIVRERYALGMAGSTILRRFPLQAGDDVAAFHRRVWSDNLIIPDTASRIDYAPHCGPLSVKCAWNGSETYVVDRVPIAVDDTSYLVLNRGRPYASSISSSRPVESLAVFFRAGFVDGVLRARVTEDDRLLDDPYGRAHPIAFFERRTPHDRRVTPHLERLRNARGVDAGPQGRGGRARGRARRRPPGAPPPPRRARADARRALAAALAGARRHRQRPRGAPPPRRAGAHRLHGAAPLPPPISRCVRGHAAPLPARRPAPKNAIFRALARPDSRHAPPRLVGPPRRVRRTRRGGRRHDPRIEALCLAAVRPARRGGAGAGRRARLPRDGRRPDGRDDAHRLRVGRPARGGARLQAEGRHAGGAQAPPP